MEKAMFGAGCFWHVEETFRKIKGVTDTAVGFAGGKLPNPTYRQVCAGNTGHAEVTLVHYDPNIVSYEALLKIFWDIHNPTTPDRQGPDVGSQYRSIIFYYSPAQAEAANKSKKELNASKRYKQPVVTEIQAASEFYRAEEYHQRYVEKKGIASCGL